MRYHGKRMSHFAEDGGLPHTGSPEGGGKIGVVLAALCAFTLLLAVFAGLIAVKLWLPSPAENEPETVQAFEPEPPPGIDDSDYILLSDSTFGKIWLPILEGVPRNPLDVSRFAMRGGRLSYDWNKVRALFGIDISTYQKEVDWEQVKEAGVEFVMLRAGFRGYGSAGVMLEDSMFQSHMAGARSVGLPVGVYFFSQALNEEEALEEAAFLLSLLEGHTIDFPVVFDWENIGSAEARTDNVYPHELAAACIAFCEAVKEAGYRPMVYFNTRQALLQYDLRKVAQYDFWLAQYAYVPSFAYAFQMWQYTDKGSVPGIEGDVDLNLCFADYLPAQDIG